MQEVELEDIERMFRGYQSDVVPQDRSAVGGFAEWANDAAGEEAGRELWEKRHVLKYEIAYTYAETVSAAVPPVDNQSIRDASDRFIDAYEDDIRDILLGVDQ